METSLEIKPHIFQSPAVFKTPEQIRAQWDEYLVHTLDKEKKMPTKAGVCFALKIRRKEWDKLKEHPVLGVAIGWMETVIEDVWLQKLVSAGANTGAWNYLKSHYPEQYALTPDGTSITVHAIVGMKVIVEK
ncbi:MAG: hypothetical protein U1D31_03435 [Patescibacteria group bacterium]|nr:hypothetical protein [Patescibacteria group bacterium]